MKKFYTAADVNICASKGETVIYINPGDVVTSVAKEEAGKKGIRFEAGRAINFQACGEVCQFPGLGLLSTALSPS